MIFQMAWKRRRWRKKNLHNSTTMCNDFCIDCVTVGKETYGELTVLTFNMDYKLSIGCYCSIASGVTFVLSADHHLNHISTFPFKVKTLQSEQYEAISKGNIIVDDDVWIGQNAIILSGVHIGQGAVIAAGAIVTKDVPPYAVVGGNPARVIKYRFNENMIQELMTLDYSKLSKDLIEEHIQEMYKPIDDAEQLVWFPKKGRKSDEIHE